MMKNKKAAKILKVSAIVIGSLILIVVIVGVSVFNFAIKPQLKEISRVMEEVISDEEILKEIEPYLDNEELVNIINQLETDGTSQALKEKAKEYEEQIKQDKANENNTDGEKNTNVSDSDTQTIKKPASEYDSQYEYIKDNVNVSDFKKGTSLASKIDIGYVMGLMSGGLTAEEKKELKSYLTSRLSSSEIAEGIRLYSKYSYLLK